jgi:drug/metabolite transporter (DMT)-like permease
MNTTGMAQSRTAGQVKGYMLVAGAYVVFGAIGALVNYARAPESILLALRFTIAAVVLALPLARRRTLAEILRSGIWWRVLLMGILDATALLCLFIALRETGVAAGMFLFFTGPVFVALLAPALTGQATDRVVWLSLVLALAGLLLILMPAFAGTQVCFSIYGVVAGLTGAIVWAFFMMVMKGLTRTVSSSALVFAECVLDCLLLLPLGLWQMAASDYVLTGRDMLSAAILGVVCTAFAYWVFVAGVGLIRVQHSSILGYLEPVTAPLYALVFLGERPVVWTLGGGVLILLAGVLVVMFGKAEEEMHP